MSKSDQIWSFQVIRLEGPSVQMRVLEDGCLPAEMATLDYAKELFLDRFQGPPYRLPHAHLKPEGVRFLNHKGEEVARYSALDMYAEQRLSSKRRTTDA